MGEDAPRERLGKDLEVELGWKFATLFAEEWQADGQPEKHEIILDRTEAAAVVKALTQWLAADPLMQHQ